MAVTDWRSACSCQIKGIYAVHLLHDEMCVTVAGWDSPVARQSQSVSLSSN